VITFTLQNISAAVVGPSGKSNSERSRCDRWKNLPATANFAEAHHLHGGPAGTGSKNWVIIERSSDAVQLQTRLLDGEMGYPGNMTVNVFYRLLDNTLENGNQRHDRPADDL